MSASLNDANGVLMDKDDFMISSAECEASTVIFCWSIPVSTTFGTMSVKALGAPKMEASIEHEGTMFNNKARLQVSYGKKVIVVDAQMDSKSSGALMLKK
jgi:hypothetical protein